MNHREQLVTELLLLLGLLVIASFVVKVSLARTSVPPLVGYMLLGAAFGVLDEELLHLSESSGVVFDFLATAGLACLLFRVGLESDLPGLLRQIRPASWLVVGNVGLSFGLGYLASSQLLGLRTLSSLFVGAALSATSVGVSVAMWRDAGRLDGDHGRLLLDAAELDDVVAVMTMSILVGLVPAFAHGGEQIAWLDIAFPLGRLLLLLALLVVGCVLFARHVEPRLTAFLTRVRLPDDAMLTVAGIGFVIAAVASLAGFSVAVGAFLAGLIFSRDPKAVRLEARFSSVYALFTPFFFLGVGRHIDLRDLDQALLPGAVLLAAAVIGKVVGTLLPALPRMDWRSGLLLGVSMVPRAEIAMAVAQSGLAAGALAPSTYAALALVAACTSLLAPIAIRRMLRSPSVPLPP